MKEFSGISGIDQGRPRRIFWEIVNGTWTESEDVYARIAFHVAYQVNLHILSEEQIISDWVKRLDDSWFSYLHDKIFAPYSINFKPDVLENLLAMRPITPTLLTLYQVTLSNDPKLLKDLLKPELGFLNFWREFLRQYGPYFSLFEKISLYLGEAIGIIEKKSLDNLYKVYQIHIGPSNPGLRAPVGYAYDLNSMLTELIHLKNATISHSNYQFLPLEKPEKVEIWDESKGKETSRQVYSRELLYNRLYTLNFLIRGIQRNALYFSFTLSIAKHNVRYTRSLRCAVCNFQFNAVVTPNKRSVKCPNCRKKLKM